MTIDGFTRILFRAADRYHLAAQQDSDVMIRFLHNSYSVAFADAIRDTVGDKEASRILGIDFPMFRMKERGV